MSQAGIVNVTGTPAVPTSFVTDVNSPAIPAGNILNVPGGQVIVNNANGIRTDGSSGGNTLTIQLTNRLSGTATTVGAVTSDVITFTLNNTNLGTTPGTLTLDIEIAAFEAGTPSGAGYSIFGSVRTTGAAAVLIGTPDKIVNEEAALVTADANLIVSGNNAVIRVTGVAGLTIDWRVLAIYTYVS